MTELEVRPAEFRGRCAVTGSVRDDVTSVYCAYGKKLKRIHVSDLSRDDDLDQIVSTCANATFDLNFYVC